MHPYFEDTLSSIYISHRKESYNFDSHFQNKIEIAYCFSGAQKIRVGETTYIMNKGDAVFVFPNVVHEYIKCESGQDVNTETVSLISDTDFFASIIPELVTKYPLSPFIPAQLISCDTAWAFRKMTETNEKMELLGFACIAISGIIKKLDLVPIKTFSSIKLAPAIISYINSNFTRNLTIKSIAAEFGYSTSYIAHVFHDQLKISFRSYLGSIRSEYAKSLILKTNKSLTEISYECGYNSLNTFCRSFKKHFGINPSDVKNSKKSL